MYLYLYSYRRETARQLRMYAQLTRCFSAVAELLVAVGDDKNKKGKERYKKSQNRYISRICREAPSERILAIFGTSREVPDVITPANFGVYKLRG